MAHNIVSGVVTRRRDHTPFATVARKIAKRTVIVAAVLFAAMLALGFALQAVQSEPAKAVPACELEDGSTQKVCVFRGSDGNDYTNHNFGEWWEVHPR